MNLVTHVGRHTWNNNIAHILYFNFEPITYQMIINLYSKYFLNILIFLSKNKLRTK